MEQGQQDPGPQEQDEILIVVERSWKGMGKGVTETKGLYLYLASSQWCENGYVAA